jgi:hypothetical protein
MPQLLDSDFWVTTPPMTGARSESEKSKVLARVGNIMLTMRWREAEAGSEAIYQTSSGAINKSSDSS